jgi:formyltetrahydrofolate hydrolase
VNGAIQPSETIVLKGNADLLVLARYMQAISDTPAQRPDLAGL